VTTASLPPHRADSSASARSSAQRTRILATRARP
jgi:hypothetical protein